LIWKLRDFRNMHAGIPVDILAMEKHTVTLISKLSSQAQQLQNRNDNEHLYWCCWIKYLWPTWTVKTCDTNELHKLYSVVPGMWYQDPPMVLEQPLCKCTCNRANTIVVSMLQLSFTLVTTDRRSDLCATDVGRRSCRSGVLRVIPLQDQATDSWKMWTNSR